METSTQSQSTSNVVDSATPQKEKATTSTYTTTEYNTIWEQVTDITKQALDKDQDDATLERVSPILNEVNQLAFELLKTRTGIWERKGNYEKEVEDAKYMMLLSPKDAVGYIRVGRRCIEQGFQREALMFSTRG